jgi:hypothetical protein
MAVLQGPDTDPSVLAQIKEAALSCIRANFICINYRWEGGTGGGERGGGLGLEGLG